MRKAAVFGALCLLSSLAAGSGAQPKEQVATPAPFRIADNLYHVGAGDSAVYLIVGSDGMVLLDGGFAEDAGPVLANIRALGFEPRRIRYLINSQAHSDHAGGLAAIKAETGAQMLASHADSALLERGGRDDPQFGDSMIFPPVKVDRFVADGERISLSGVTVTAHLTPGHTPGCTSWSMRARDGARRLDALFNCGATAPGYRLIGNPAYPDIVRDFERSFAKWRRLPCDLFLGAHGSYYGLERKRESMREGRRNPFVDPRGCRSFLAKAEKAVADQLKQERAGH